MRPSTGTGPGSGVASNLRLAAYSPSFVFLLKSGMRRPRTDTSRSWRLKADSAADSLANLYRNLAVLGAKRGPVLFQLPPFLKKDLPRLAEFLAPLPKGHRATFEFRNERWFADDVYEALALGEKARRDVLARDLRVLHARAHRAAIRAGPDAMRLFGGLRGQRNRSSCRSKGLEKAEIRDRTGEDRPIGGRPTPP